MKTTLRNFFTAGLAVFALFQGHSQGFLVTNGVTSGGFNTIHVIQSPTTLDYTGFFLWSQGPNTFRFDSFVDEGVRAFFVEGGAPVTAQAIQAQSYPELTFPNNYFFPNGLSFYVGLYTGYGYTGTYTDPVFGWAELVNNNGTVQLLDSALVANAPGIYAGTTTIIPEPGMLTLFGLGALLLGRHIRRKNSR